MTVFEKSRRFIYRNARPLEFACWQYLFEGGSREAVLKALAAYQNDDGGFGHALEADFFNPASTPIQTWKATEILRMMKFEDAQHPVVRGILAYLESGADFDTQQMQWLNTVESNNAYPHAVWWNYGENGSDFRYNPTACLAGFIVRFAEESSPVYEKACGIVRDAFEWFEGNVPFAEPHITCCFIRMYEYLKECAADIVDMERLERLIRQQADFNICRDKTKWGVEYVCLPSDLISGEGSILFEENSELLNDECDLILRSQLDDGSFIVPWQWYNDYCEYTLAANWWKSSLIIGKMSLLRAMGRV